MVIVWNNNAIKELKTAYEYILKSSYQNAHKVKEDIISAILNLHAHPERYPLDKYKKENDGTWRAFELHHYRISYRIFKKELRIVRIRHTSQSPLLY